MTRFRVSGKPLVKPQGEWLRVSHEMTWEIEDMTESETWVVKISPDAGFDDSAFEDGKLKLGPDGKPTGEQHPGVTFPSLGIIELNAKYLPDGVTPDTMSPLVRKDHARYPVIWGLAAHEAAHARFSKWMDEIDRRARNGKLTQMERKYVGAATILEESRIEKKQMHTRPQDQVWLQASGTKLALEEVTAQMAEAKELLKEARKEDESAHIQKAAIARAAALVLARIDAGSVEPDANTDSLTKLVEDTFGKKDSVKLRAIWTEAQRTGDEDADTMLKLGKRWYELTGDDGGAGGEDGEEVSISVGMGGSGDGDEESDQDGNALGKALKGAADNAEKEANGESERERRQRRVAQVVDKRKLDANAAKEAKSLARATFAGKGDNMSHPIRGYRAPTPSELNLARSTRRALQAAYLPEKAVTKTTRQLPPGRLSMRAVRQHDAQISVGQLPDAEPFTYKDRRHVSTPPLKVAIIQDVSGSQGAAAAAAASGAWSLAKAAQMISDATVAMVSFGDRVNAIIRPGEKLSQVPILQTPYGTDYFVDALKAVEGQLDLTRSGSARLVVVLTDGYFSGRDMQNRDAAIKRLTDTGVKFLWMVTDGSGEDPYVPAKNKLVHVFKDASGNFGIVPKVINVEAVNALKKRGDL